MATMQTVEMKVLAGRSQRRGLIEAGVLVR
jgi:hypothetical protein